MENNRIKAKEDMVQYTKEICEALQQADFDKLNRAREGILKCADIIFSDERDKINAYKIVAASYSGAYNQADILPLAKKIVKIAKEIYPKNSREQVEAYDLLAQTSFAAGNYDDTRKLAEELYRYYYKKYGKEVANRVKIVPAGEKTKLFIKKTLNILGLDEYNILDIQICFTEDFLWLFIL